MEACGNRTAERGNIGRRVPGILHHGTATPADARPHWDRGVAETREGPASFRPVLTRSDASCSASFMLRSSVRSPWLQPAAQWVRGPPCRPAGTRTGANAASLHTPDFTPSGLLWGATETDIGDATSTRRIGLLGRACRLHRQLLSTRGNGGCSVCRSLASSIHLAPRRVNPTRTGHSRRPWSRRLVRHANFTSHVI